MEEAVCTKIAWILKTMKKHFGEEAYQVIVKTQGEMIREYWRKKAENIEDNSIEALIKHVWEPQKAINFIGVLLTFIMY